MKAFILAAGLGTRLKPWTLSHPKALVPVGGVPMLERVIVSLRKQGFNYIVVNVHHFAGQIVEFLDSRDFGVEIHISDESEALLDTGGAILHAAPLLCADSEPFLIHNVDILSDADLSSLMQAHRESGRLSTLLVSRRESSRRLIFNPDMTLQGWHNIATGEYRPEGFVPQPDVIELAFSGVYVMNPALIEKIRRLGWHDAFPVMDMLLSMTAGGCIGGLCADSLNIIDIGKPQTLELARNLYH